MTLACILFYSFVLSDMAYGDIKGLPSKIQLLNSNHSRIGPFPCNQLFQLTFKKKFVYLILAVLGLLCCTGSSLVAVSGDYSLLFDMLASHCGGLSCCRAQALGLPGFQWLQLVGSEHRLSSCGTLAQLCQSSGIFPDQGLNPCLLNWQADSLPLSHQGSPSDALMYCTEVYGAPWRQSSGVSVSKAQDL